MIIEPTRFPAERGCCDWKQEGKRAGQLKIARGSKSVGNKRAQTLVLWPTKGKQFVLSIAERGPLQIKLLRVAGPRSIGKPSLTERGLEAA